MAESKIILYIDDSRESTEVFNALKSKGVHLVVSFRSGPSDKIPAVETRSSIIEGYDNVRRYVLGD